MYVQISARTVQISTTLIATSLAYKLVAASLRRWFRAKYTAVYDVDDLSSQSGKQETKKGTVIIAGGSIAGLFTARICSDFFTDVIIVDPEVFKSTEKQNPTDDANNKRSGVFQYYSLHAYQAFTLLTLRKLFPGFDQHLAAAGGHAACDSMFHTSGRRVPAPSMLKTEAMALSRDIFEPLLRRLVLSNRPNIKCIHGSVTSVQPTTDTWERLASATISSKDSGEATVYPAALVIDCTGRAAHGYRWLKGTPLDVTGKENDVAKGHLPYSDLTISYDHKVVSRTWEFVVPTNFLKTVGCPVDGPSLTLYACFPDYRQDNSGRAIIFALFEHNRLLISFGGHNCQDSVTSAADIRAFMSRMILYEPIPDWIHNMLDALEENDYPTRSWMFRVPPSRYIRYHSAAKLPCNFVALGDSVLTLNPGPGQGCTKACIEAVTLGGMLKSVRKVDSSGVVVIPSGFSKKFFRAQFLRTGHLWDSNRVTDYGFEAVVPAKGEDQSFGEAKRAFTHESILPMISTDDILAVKFWRIAGFLEAPTELMFPSALFRMWWNVMKAKYLT